MKKHVQLSLAGAAIGVASLVAVAHGATAVSFPKVARGVNTWMARAVDQCNPATVSVATTGSPSVGCLQANATTDGTLGMRFTKLRVTSAGRIGMFANGFTLGDEVRVRLLLRISKAGVTTVHPLQTLQNVTFSDVTVDCPPAPFAFSARPNGAVVGTTTLASCFAAASPVLPAGLTKGNVNMEILDSSLVNALTGKVVAVPGFVR